MGLGLLGRGVGDTRFLAEQGADLIVTDLKTEDELKSSLDQLKEFSNITYRLGEHHLDDFKDRDLILKAAGVPLNSIYIEEAKNNNIPVRMSADLLVELSGTKSVGITGTRGKSTVTHLIARTLKQAGRKVVLGGNVRGVSNLALLKEVTEDSILVLELDSWQCQGFGEAKMSPNVAVFTNLMPDHLNYYPDMQTYFNDKANIYRFQKEGDVFIAGKKVTKEWITDAIPMVPKSIPDDWQLRIVGAHNRENASLAAEALRSLGVSDSEIKDGLESFKSVEGRLQFLREVNGVKIYNDNNATTPDATKSGIEAVADGKNVILIMGGADKGIEFDILYPALEKYVKQTILLPGTGSDKVRDKIDGIGVTSLKEAVQTAVNTAQDGGVILFSPAFASFGMFTNEYDRNDQFVKLINEL